MIRARLARWVVVLVAIVLAGFAASVFSVTRNGLLTEVEREITNRVNSLATAVEREGDDALSTTYLARYGTADVVVAVYDSSGELVAHSDPVDGRVPSFGTLAPLATEEPGAATDMTEIDLDGPLHVTTRTVELDDGRRVVVAVGRSPDLVYQAMSRLAQVLVPATLVALAVIGGAVWLLLRRALRPLEQLDAEAGKVAAAGDHEARIEGDYRGDEVGTLARSVDSMLVSLSAEHNRAQVASETQREFLADVSHELRAPLAIVSSTLQLAHRVGHDDPAVLNQLLADASSETDRMGRIVSQLLLMARTGAESRAADHPLLLAELVASTGRRWASLFPRLTIDSSGLAPVADVVVNGNSDHLRQVFDILLDNATRYTPPGGGIEFRGVLAPGERVVVEVRDSGVGLDEDELELVFERFYRGRDGGTGLGLAIARHVVEGHGGSISARAGSEVGTVFSVELPCWLGETALAGSSADRSGAGSSRDNLAR